MKTAILILVGLISTALQGRAQHHHPQHHKCAAADHLAAQLAQNPGMAARRQAIEAHTQQVGASGARSGSNVIQIPVVVHVLYNTAAEDISQSQIQSQIDVLNEDFRMNNANSSNTLPAFSSVAADVEIEFRLAQVDPYGERTTGITRRWTPNPLFLGETVKFDQYGGTSAWPRDDYLNIWVCTLVPGLLGTGQFPGGPAATDGIVVANIAFGREGTATAPYNGGRTATHEVGHWLNLGHIWGDPQLGQNGCSVDDGVGDTPLAEAPNYGCPTNPSSCNSPDMYQNYMDYTDDACQTLFTEDQKTRMRALFASGGARESLLSSPGLCTEGGAYQTNQPESSAILDGTLGTANSPGIVLGPPAGFVGLGLYTTLPSGALRPYDIWLTFTPALPAATCSAAGRQTAGGIRTAGGQIINVDLDAPGLWLNGGGPIPDFTQDHPGSRIVSLQAPSTPGFIGSGQQAVLSPVQAADGFFLSQPCQLTVVCAPATTQGPAGDDSSVVVPLSQCAVPFYGTGYTEIFVSSNGRLTFGAADNGWQGTVQNAQNGPPSVGFFTDLDPSSGGIIEIAVDPMDPQLLTVDYVGVPYHGSMDDATFVVAVDLLTGDVVMEALDLIMPNGTPATWGDQFLGISPGAGASDPGATTFSPGGMGSGGPNDMIYDCWSPSSLLGGGLPPSLLPGTLFRLHFQPTGQGGYDWLGS